MKPVDAFEFIVESVRGRAANTTINLWKVVGAYVQKYEQSADVDTRTPQISPAFLEAAWDLALLGVLRPAGLIQIPDAGGEFDGTQYLLTEFGAVWVNEGEEDAFVPIGSETFVTLLEDFAEFGPEFIERARDSARCWRAKAYLACCAMCGAASEAILLAVAIARTGNREEVLVTYNGKSGRRRIETLVTGSLRAELRDTLAPLFGLVKYWRDQASHGAAAAIRQPEARTAMQTLYLYAKMTHNNWNELTRTAV